MKTQVLSLMLLRVEPSTLTPPLTCRLRSSSSRWARVCMWGWPAPHCGSAPKTLRQHIQISWTYSHADIHTRTEGSASSQPILSDASEWTNERMNAKQTKNRNQPQTEYDHHPPPLSLCSCQKVAFFPFLFFTVLSLSHTHSLSQVDWSQSQTMCMKVRHTDTEEIVIVTNQASCSWRTDLCEILALKKAGILFHSRQTVTFLELTHSYPPTH